MTRAPGTLVRKLEAAECACVPRIPTVRWEVEQTESPASLRAS